MKKRRFIAALLCYAMVLTSQGIMVNAATLDNAVTNTAAMEGIVEDDETLEAVSVQDDELQGGSLSADELTEMEALSDENRDDELSSVTSSLSDDAVLTPDITGDSLSSDSLADDPEDSEDDAVSNEGAGDPSACFTWDTDGTLKLTGGYDSLEKFEDSAVVIPKEVKKIPADVKLFAGNTTVKIVQFETGGTGELYIAPGAFQGSNVETFYAPANYKKVQKNTFANCAGLLYFEFNEITQIDEGAFSGCTSLGSNLTKLKGHNNISLIGKNAFSNTGFITLNITNLVAKENATVSANAFSACNNLATVNTPASFTSIPEGCFENCSSLTKLTIAGEGTIGKNAFKNCKKLVTTSLGKISAIDEYAFQNCTSLADLVFPETIDGKDGVNIVKTNAFSGCTAIKTIRFDYNGTETDRVLAQDGAFPDAIKVTVSGYIEKLQEYVNKVNATPGKNWVYKNLLNPYKIKMSSNIAGICGVIVTANGKDTPLTKTSQAATVKPGTEVKLKISMSTDKYGIVGNSLSDGEGTEFTFVSYSKYQYFYKFKMPAHDVELNFATYVKAAVANKYLEYTVDGYDSETQFVPDGKNTKIDYGAGKKGRLLITSSYGGDNIPLCEGVFKYTSSNTGVATISELGVITVLKEGTTKITATYKHDSNVKLSFTLYSNGTAKIEKESMSITVDGDDPFYYTVPMTFDDETLSVNVVPIDKNEVNSVVKKFNIKLNVKNEKGQNIYVTAKWTSGDKSIATVASASNMTNSNTVTVPKGAYGETYVRAAVTSGKDTYYAYMVIRVADYTPKVVESNISIKLSHKAEDQYGGAGLTIVPVNGFDFDADKANITTSGGYIHPELYQLNTGNGKYELRKGFKLHYVGTNGYLQHQYRLIATGEGLTAGMDKGTSKSFSGKNTLYIRCSNGVMTGKDYYIPISMVTVTNTNPQYSLKMTGKINLLYNADSYSPLTASYDPEVELPRKPYETDEAYTERYVKATIGYVKFSNPIPVSEARLRAVELVSDDHYDKIIKNGCKYVADPNDKLANNFRVMADQNGTDWYILRTGNEMAKEGGNDVVSGRILYYYYGISKVGTRENFIAKKITIPTKVKAPKDYYLSPKSSTDSTANANNTYKFKLMNRLTKKEAVTITDLETDGVTIDHTKNYSRFTNVSMGANGTIGLVANALPAGKSVAAVNIQRVNWDRPATYLYTVNVTDKLPKISVKPKTVTLNNNKDEDIGEIKLSLNQKNARIVPGTIVYSGNGAVPAIDFTNSGYGDTPNIYVVRPHIERINPVAKGTYKYKCLVSYEYVGKVQRELKTVTFKVKVVNTQPSIKLSVKSYTYNYSSATYAEKEVYKPYVTIKGMRLDDKDYTSEIDLSGMVLTPVKVKASALANATTVMNALEIDPEYDPNKEKVFFNVKIDDIHTLPVTSFSYTYQLSGIKVYGSLLKPIKITVKGTTKAPRVLIKASGTLNPLDPKSSVKYTMTVKNFSKPVVSTNVIVYESDPDTWAMVPSTHFRAERDPKNQLITRIYPIVDRGTSYDKHRSFENKNYKLKIGYRLADGVYVETKEFNIKPRQTKPAYKLSPKTLQFASTLDGYRTRQTAETTLTKKSALRAHVTDVKLRDDNALLLRNAFKVSYADLDPDPYYLINGLRSQDKTCPAGKIVVECIAPELLKKGKTYKLKVNIETDGQFYADVKQKDGTYKMQKVKGSVIEIPVVVNR